jgi:CcmD family protein
MPSNETFVIAAYSITWVVLLGYFTYLVRHARRARAEFDRHAGTGAGNDR